MIEYAEIEGLPDEKTLADISRFYASIFGQVDYEKFSVKISEAKDLLTILALENGVIVGFKIGYRIAPQKFYSWLGGVAENRRNKNIARELMKRQHKCCAAKGYQTIQTKTKNSFKPMLILNLKSGFDVIEVYRNSKNELKIVLEKSLSNI